MRTAIRFEAVSKQYLLGKRRDPADDLQDRIANAFRSAVRRLGDGRGSHSGEGSAFWALTDVSFDVKEGERVAIVGRNGAGKSTLLKILSRITEPTSGRIKVNGRIGALLEVGTGFHPELTGRENIYLNGAVLGMTRTEIRRKFDDIVAFAEVEKFLDTPVKRYSSGMYVRLAFSVAAHLEPEILVIDEVLAVGDARFQKKCLGKMEEVGRSGRTVLFVSHNMTAVRTLCNRAVLLDEGRVAMDGPVTEVAAHYLGAGIQQQLATGRTWTGENAPRNGSARLRSVSVRSGDESAPDLTIDSPFHVDVEFEVTQPNAVVGMTLVLHDAEGTCIFSSIANREPRWYGKPMPVGPYRSRCTIPANLLNAGTFSLTVIVFGEGFSDALTLRDVLLFRVDDSDALRRGYSGAWSGAVRPALDWITTSVNGSTK